MLREARIFRIQLYVLVLYRFEAVPFVLLQAAQQFALLVLVVWEHLLQQINHLLIILLFILVYRLTLYKKKYLPIWS